MGTMYVSPSVRTEGSSLFEFGQFHAYQSAFPAIVRALTPYVDKEASIVDVGCGHGMLVEAWRASGHTSNSYCVEGSDNVGHTWPREHIEQFYRVLDLVDHDAVLPPTDYVQTFEVAEHLPPERAEHFVQLLTGHSPRLVFFGAATVDQDRGRNPTHVNENTMAYWVDKFDARGYGLDAARSAQIRAALLMDPGYQTALQTGKAWWYAKNVMVFAPLAKGGRQRLDAVLTAAPESVLAGHFSRLIHSGDTAVDSVAHIMEMLYRSMFDRTDGLGPMWRRDWEAFASLYLTERLAAVARIQAAKEQTGVREEL